MLVHIHFKEVVRMKTFVTALIYIQVVYVCICNPYTLLCREQLERI